jgi:hypothetical protein
MATNGGILTHTTPSGVNYIYTTSQFTVGKVMVEPFPDKSAKTEVTGEGSVKVVRFTNTKTELVRLKLLADSLRADGTALAHIGGHVWVRADLYATDWGKNVFVSPVDGTKFVLLPADRVEVFE